MKVTLQMIADQVGVTCATVSMALRNDFRISEARRDEIKKVAEALGYHPNAMVSSLMSHIRQSKPPPQRTGLLYLVSGIRPTPGPTPEHSLSRYYRGAAEQAARLGFHIEPFWMRQPGLTGSRIDKIIRSRGVPGVIVAPREDTLPLPDLAWGGFATVMIGYSFAEPKFDRVLTNFYNSTRMAMEFIRRELHPPVRLILPTQHDRNVQHLWTAGYLRERLGRERHFQAPLVVDTPERVVTWVKNNPGCTVLGTYLIRKWLREAGLREHKHFRFVSLNVEGEPETTGIREPTEVIGASAADLLISRIMLNRKGPPDHAHVTLVDPTWQNGAWKSRA